MRWITVVFLAVLVLAALTEQVAATPHDDAKDAADKISKAINSVTLPYERELTMQDLAALGYPTETMTRPGTYIIRIKSASYDSDKGLLTVNINAWHNGTSLKVRNPIHWYMPMSISGSNNPQRLTTFVKMLMFYLEERQYGQPENDDTLIVYATGAGSGDIYEDTDGSWATMRGDAGDGAHANPARAYMYITASTTSDVWSSIYRVGLSFNTSGLGSGSTVSSAALDVPGYGKSNTFTTAHNLALTGFNPATDGALVTGDYATFADTRLDDSDVTYANFDINDRYGYNLWDLNAAGLAYVSLTGYTNLMLRGKGDVDNSVVWESGASTYYNVHITTAGKIPKLTIEYTPGGGSAPVAAFSANTTTGYPPFDIAFTDSSTNTPTGWEWLFGDGDTASTQNPVHIYDTWIGNTIAKYTVNLTASNAFGSDAENKTDYITAFPLNASFSVNVTSGCAPVHIGFNSTGTGNGTATTWDWNFGGDGTSSDQNPTHIFTTPGTYWISLNASNSYSWDIENKTELITITSGTVAAFSANDTVGCPDLHVQFTDASVGTNINNWSWDFTNDGTPDSYEQNPVAVYSTPGTYTVNLTATGDCGTDSEVKTDYITVSNNVVSAGFSADDTSVVTGQTVTFTDSSTGGPTAWAWSWGDLTANGTTQNPTHAYATPGDYTVILTATNDCGGSDVEEKVSYINVTAAPTVTPTPTPFVGEGNVTYIYGPDQDYVPYQIWFAIVMSMLVFFFHSILFIRNSDLTAMIALGLAALSAWLSNMIGYLTLDIAAVGEDIILSPVIKAVHPPWLVWVMIGFVGVSIVNIYAAIWKVYLKPVPWNEIYNRRIAKVNKRR